MSISAVQSSGNSYSTYTTALPKTEQSQAETKTETSQATKEIDFVDPLSMTRQYFDDLRNKAISHYQKVNTENNSFADPRAHINDKYMNKNSRYFRHDMSEEERRIAMGCELDMLAGREVNINLKDSIFRGEIKDHFTLNAQEKQINRDNMNAQIKGIFENAGIKIPDGKTFQITINPYNYEISVTGLDDENLKQQIETALSQGKSGKNLFLHINSSLTTDNTQGSFDKRTKYDLFHSILNSTGYDIRTLENRNGVLLTPDGQDVVNIYKEKAPMGDMYREYAAADLRERIAKMLETGWDNMEDMFLSIDYKDGYLYDVGQKYGYGPEQEKEPWF